MGGDACHPPATHKGTKTTVPKRVRNLCTKNANYPNNTHVNFTKSPKAKEHAAKLVM